MGSEPHLPVYWDEVYFKYATPPGAFNLPATDLLAVDENHPDQIARNKNIKRILEKTLSEHITWESVTPATTEQLTRVHDPDYVESVKEFSDAGGGRFTVFETGGNEYTWEAATKASGGSIQVAERALETGIHEVPYSLSRPSGHHAQPAQADGYCLLNNVSVAAEHLRATGQVDSVAILDWDVHHGNGSQEIFYDRDDVLVINLHNDHGSWHPKTHPQSGRTSEKGTGPGKGYNMNIPLPYGTGNRGYEYAFHYLVEPIIADFDPDIIIVSAGQDAGALDPLGRNLVTKSGFEMMGRRARRLAADHADGSLAIVQEGGYQISHLAFATLGALEGALNVTAEYDGDGPVDWLADPFGNPEKGNFGLATEWIHQVGEEYADYWPLMFA